MHNFNEVVSPARFPEVLKSAEVTTVVKKKSRIDKENCIRLIDKQLIFLNQFFLNISADFGKVIVQNTVYSL